MSLLLKILGFLMLQVAPLPLRREKPKTETEKDLVIEEYKSCRDLIGRNIEVVERNETYVVGGCAAIFAFSVDKAEGWFTVGTAILPVTLALVGAARFWALHTTINKIDDYIVSVERDYPCIGYTTAYRGNEPKSKLKYARWGVWIVLIAATSFFCFNRISDAQKTNTAVTAKPSQETPGK